MEVVVGVFLPALMLRDYGRHAPRPSMEFAREITPYENPSIGGRAQAEQPSYLD
jgi:hypothetical protein